MLQTPLFHDRIHAGEQLARVILLEISLEDPENLPNPIIYALPRGGLPIAAPIAQSLHCPLSVIVAKKITRPDNPELAVGAVTADGHVLWSRRKPLDFNLQQSMLQEAHSKALAQWQQFSPLCPEITPEGSLAILVDDGIATGMTMAAAAKALRTQHPMAIWICVPVAPLELIEPMQQWCDRLIVLETPNPFLSVSRFYQEFNQVDTQTALSYLQS